MNCTWSSLSPNCAVLYVIDRKHFSLVFTAKLSTFRGYSIFSNTKLIYVSIHECSLFCLFQSLLAQADLMSHYLLTAEHKLFLSCNKIFKKAFRTILLFYFAQSPCSSLGFCSLYIYKISPGTGDCRTNMTIRNQFKKIASLLWY